MPPKNADVVQKLQPIGQPTDGNDRGRRGALGCGQLQPERARAEARHDLADVGSARSRPRPGYRRIQAMPSPRTMWSASTMRFDPRDRRHVPADDDRRPAGEISRTMRHISRTLPDVDDDRRDAHDVVAVRAQFRREGLPRGKIQHVVGAEMFFWIIRMPHDRWNMRSENGPCSRVTWLWYSSIGLILRLPNSSSWA